MAVASVLRFWRELLSAPASIGAIAPSSSFLARRMTDWIDWDGARTVIECGPGTGAMTTEILRRLRPGARFVAIELNPNLARVLRGRLPQVEVLVGSAGDLPDLCGAAGVPPADAVLSSLPWASFPEPLQRGCLEAIRGALAPRGQFVTFAYNVGLLTARGRRFRRLLPACFSEVSESPTAWLNLPPAFVYRCRK